MEKTQAEAAREQAMRAMLQQAPKTSPLQDHIVRGNGGGQTADAMAAKPGTLTLIDRINEMANRDQEDWKYLTETLRKFVAQRRADLDYLDRLLGTHK